MTDNAWPAQPGLLGRRAGFLIVFTGVLGYCRTQAGHIQPTDVTNSTNTDVATGRMPRIRGHVLSSSDDPMP